MLFLLVAMLKLPKAFSTLINLEGSNATILSLFKVLNIIDLQQLTCGFRMYIFVSLRHVLTKLCGKHQGQFSGKEIESLKMTPKPGGNSSRFVSHFFNLSRQLVELICCYSCWPSVNFAMTVFRIVLVSLLNFITRHEYLPIQLQQMITRFCNFSRR